MSRARATHLSDLPLTYAAVGASQSASVSFSPPAGYRGRSARARIGDGDARWRFAAAEVQMWGVKTRSGFRIEIRKSVVLGDDVVVRFGPIREPVRVVAVIDTPERRGFSYGTLPGHPIRGEETFVVDRTADGAVWLTVSSFSRAAAGPWALAYPVLLIAQRVFLARYLRALACPIQEES